MVGDSMVVGFSVDVVSFNDVGFSTVVGSLIVVGGSVRILLSDVVVSLYVVVVSGLKGVSVDLLSFIVVKS